MRAQESEPPEPGPAQPQYGWREVWSGADALRDVWLLYSGITLAPWSEHVYASGWRVRAQGGYGEYDYVLQREGEPERTFRGAVSYGDALVGYHFRSGALTAKVFAGVSFIEHRVRPGASGGRLVGPEWGPKLATELWLDIGEAQWTSLNLSFTTAHNTVSARWRYGFSMLKGLSAGPELRFDSNAGLYQSYGDLFDQYAGRAGLFAAYKWDSYELTFAGGAAAFMNGNEGEQLSPYATLNFLVQY